MVKFFKDYFVIINPDNLDWIAPQEQILTFINSIIDFETENKDFKELNNETVIIDKTTLSRYKKD